MYRHLTTVITKASSLSWCDAALLAQGHEAMQAGLPAPVAHTHDFGRETDDITTSGEGHG